MDTTRIVADILEAQPIVASAPCRVDLGGTLDISSFYYPLRYLVPCTFNIAIDMRTRVKILPHEPGRVRISSRGFNTTEFPINDIPFDHPLGLMFAIAAYFRIDGIHIVIDSSSPPRSALGGSSAAAVALVAAFCSLLRLSGQAYPVDAHIPILAHAIEESVAGVPCGMQDQLAAFYGGVNAWYWKERIAPRPYERRSLIDPGDTGTVDPNILVAYCGIPHESKNINGIWIRQFLSGQYRAAWCEVVDCTKRFADAFERRDFATAVAAMNRETAIRCEMTPAVLDDLGTQLVESARHVKCGARFTGAGGGGCLWAIGDSTAIAELKPLWTALLCTRDNAQILDVTIDPHGLEYR